MFTFYFGRKINELSTRNGIRQLFFFHKKQMTSTGRFLHKLQQFFISRHHLYHIFEVAFLKSKGKTKEAEKGQVVGQIGKNRKNEIAAGRTVFSQKDR